MTLIQVIGSMETGEKELLENCIELEYCGHGHKIAICGSDLIFYRKTVAILISLSALFPVVCGISLYLYAISIACYVRTPSKK